MQHWSNATSIPCQLYHWEPSDQTSPIARFSQLCEQRTGDCRSPERWALEGAERLSWVPVQACGQILNIWSQSFLSLDPLCDISRLQPALCWKLVTGVQNKLHSCDPQEKFSQTSFGCIFPFYLFKQKVMIKTSWTAPLLKRVSLVKNVLSSLFLLQRLQQENWDILIQFGRTRSSVQ